MARRPLRCAWVRVTAETGEMGAAVVVLFYLSVALWRWSTSSFSTSLALSPVPVWKRDILSRRGPNGPWVYGAPKLWLVLLQARSID